MKSILCFTILLCSVFEVFAQSDNQSNRIILKEFSEGRHFTCQYLGSNKDFTKNFFCYHGYKCSGIEALDTLENDIRAIVCTDSH